MGQGQGLRHLRPHRSLNGHQRRSAQSAKSEDAHGLEWPAHARWLHQNHVFGVTKLVSYVSQFMTLEPGDVITTGTPPGVGMGVKKDGKPAPVFLKKGDVMHVGIQGLGEQMQ